MSSDEQQDKIRRRREARRAKILASGNERLGKITQTFTGTAPTDKPEGEKVIYIFLFLFFFFFKNSYIISEMSCVFLSWTRILLILFTKLLLSIFLNVETTKTI